MSDAAPSSDAAPGHHDTDDAGTHDLRQPPSAALRPIDRLLAIMARLRDPETGCPWDREQNYKSIAPYTVEEAYEVADALERGDMDDFREELGDLLLQIVFQAQMASEENLFTFDDVAAGLSEKLIYRHPHVFGDAQAATPDEVVKVWDARKAAEKTHTSAIDGVTIGLPALLRAGKLQKKAAKAGFEWPDLNAAWAKVEEELIEVKEAAAQNPQSPHTAEEIGDLLFCLVNYARMAGHDTEQILTQTNRKFETQFKAMEQNLQKDAQDLKGASLDQMLQAWRKGKSS